MGTTNLVSSGGNKCVTPHLASLLYRSSRTPKGVHRWSTTRTSRNNASKHRMRVRRTKGLLWLWLLHAVGGHGAIKERAVALMVGMVDVGLLGESGKLLLTNDGSKKASFL